jgi:hypothetical protein
MKMPQPPTATARRRASAGVRSCFLRRLLTTSWLCWVGVFTLPLHAQVPPQVSPEAAAQMIMRPQTPVDNSQPANLVATAEFDPPAVRPGEKTTYRVTINATQNSIRWPDEIALPAGLSLGPSARGQLTQPDGTPFRPLTEFIYEVTPAAAGRLVITNFSVPVGRQAVEIPAATLDVAETNAAAPAARKITLEVSATNLFFGQPFRVRVIYPATAGSQLEGLRDVQFNGGGFLTDKLSVRQAIEPVGRGDKLVPAFTYETTATPLAAGPQTMSAQGFSVPPFSAGPMTITARTGPVMLGGAASGRPIFLVSDAVQLNVRPLPEEAAPAGFTGALGKFLADKPQLSTNRVRIGEPLHLRYGFHGEGDLTRFVPPATPHSRDWQIIADPAPAMGFTLIPQTDEATNTPAIPFSAFDPELASYVDLTIPPLPVTMIGDGLPVQLPVLDDEGKTAAPLKLSGLAPVPGKTAANLRPLQLRGGFVIVQLLPVMGFVALWQWDRRRRFLEAHPEIVRRRQARRALRRERRRLQTAAAAGEAAAFVAHAAEAMRVAVAPHFPADPHALVCGDVLAQLNEAERNGRAAETVRIVFAAADARFALAPETQADLLALPAAVEAVLLTLEEKL